MPLRSRRVAVVRHGMAATSVEMLPRSTVVGGGGKLIAVVRD
jgi:hypothetical protein